MDRDRDRGKVYSVMCKHGPEDSLRCKPVKGGGLEEEECNFTEPLGPSTYFFSTRVSYTRGTILLEGKKKKG